MLGKIVVNHVQLHLMLSTGQLGENQKLLLNLLNQKHHLLHVEQKNSTQLFKLLDLSVSSSSRLKHLQMKIEKDGVGISSSLETDLLKIMGGQNLESTPHMKFFWEQQMAPLQ